MKSLRSAIQSIVVSACLAGALTASAEDAVMRTQANVMAELSLRAGNSYSDPFNDVKLDVIFTDPRGRELRVPAFWAGSNVWKARYASPITGTHAFRSECSKRQDKGLHGV